MFNNQKENHFKNENISFLKFILCFADDDLGSTFKGSNVNDCQGFCKSIPDCEFISHDVTNKICSFKGSAGRPRKNVK